MNNETSLKVSVTYFVLIVELSKAFKQGDAVQLHRICLIKNETQGIHNYTAIHLFLAKL